MNRFAALVLSAVAALAFAGQAAAHAHLVSSDPAANATVASPKVLTLHFSEGLEPKFSGLELTKADGTAVAAKASVPATDHKAMVADLAAPLAAGGYKVAWHAVASDGHASKGAYTFTVR